MTAHKVLLFTAIVLIALGVFGYISIGGTSFTPLIAPLIGIILLALYVPVKKENPTAAHVAAGLTALTAVMFLVVGFMRGVMEVQTMGIVCLVATFFYISDFMRRKRERESSKSE